MLTAEPNKGTKLMTLTSAVSTQAVVKHHLEGFFARDLQAVLADYTPDAVMIVPTGVLRGVNEIRPFFEALIIEFSQPGATFNLQQQEIEADVGYIRWAAETASNNYELGTDTFVVRDGKIVAQTFAFKATPQT
jgi:ketosteroid isomerase-like protein